MSCTVCADMTAKLELLLVISQTCKGLHAIIASCGGTRERIREYVVAKGAMGVMCSGPRRGLRFLPIVDDGYHSQDMGLRRVLLNFEERTCRPHVFSKHRRKFGYVDVSRRRHCWILIEDAHNILNAEENWRGHTVRDGLLCVKRDELSMLMVQISNEYTELLDSSRYSIRWARHVNRFTQIVCEKASVDWVVHRLQSGAAIKPRACKLHGKQKPPLCIYIR